MDAPRAALRNPGGPFDGAYHHRVPSSLGDEWLSTQVAAQHLGITTRTLYRLIDEGEMPAYKFGRVIRLRVTEVEQFIEASRITPGSLQHLYPDTAPPEAEDPIEG